MIIPNDYGNYRIFAFFGNSTRFLLKGAAFLPLISVVVTVPKNFPYPSRPKMHTAEASSKNSAVDLSVADLRTYCDSGLPLDCNHRVPRHTDDPPASRFLKNRDMCQDAGPAVSDRAVIPDWKRVLDIICIIVALPIWLPIFLLIALWVKIASPGPIFFRQERIGFAGSRFMVLKFRTMKVNVETGSHERHFEQLINANVPMTKLDSGDPRIIAGGKILRATGLDELPQLINVLRGEMSLVGPRPCTPHEFRIYKSWQRERVNGLPGLTGYWQVNGKNRTTFSEMIDMDIYYVRNLTIWLDLEVILRTVPAIIAQVVETRILPKMQAQTMAIRQTGKERLSEQAGQ